MGAAGAEVLVKGDWPELRVLNIGWDKRAMMLCIAHNREYNLYQYQHASLQLGRAGILSP